MAGTDEPQRFAHTFGQDRRSTMPADVMKGARGTVLVAADDDRQSDTAK